MDTFYEKYGVAGYYQQFHKSYANPHEDKIVEIFYKHLVTVIPDNLDISIVDIACGNGLVSKMISKINPAILTVGIDPYFENKYCHMKLSFDDIISGSYPEKMFDVAFCCYAYHLINKKDIFAFLTSVSLFAKKFVVISPSKKDIFEHPAWKITKNVRENKITVVVLEKI